MTTEEAPTDLVRVVTLSDEHLVTNYYKINVYFYIKSINFNLIKTNGCQFQCRVMCEKLPYKATNKTTQADVGLISIRGG